MQFDLQGCCMPSTQPLHALEKLKHHNFMVVNSFIDFISSFCRFIVPMKNGDLDGKGLLASIIQAEGTIESFKVCILSLNFEEQITPSIIFLFIIYCQ
jgi:ABC-type enterochelin transport system ATPase subunit